MQVVHKIYTILQVIYIKYIQFYITHKYLKHYHVCI